MYLCMYVCVCVWLWKGEEMSQRKDRDEQKGQGGTSCRLVEKILKTPHHTPPPLYL